VDYESMTTPQLQAECKRRGLPSGRVKAELVDRLIAADAAADPADESAAPEMTVEPEPERVVNEVFPQPERATPEPVTPNTPPLDVPQRAAVPPNVFRRTFPAGPEGPNDDQHASYRAQTLQAAEDAGLTTRGDARRVGTVEGREVYEVSVRQVT
jgi:hypothetical protein